MKPGALPIRLWRVITAFGVAPWPVALAVAGWGMGTEPMGMAHRFFSILILGLLFAAYPCGILLGIPAYLFLKGRVRPTWLNCAGVGLVVALLPWSVLVLMATPESEFDGARFVVEHGERTLWGWIDLGQSAAEVAVLGAITGVVFWAVATAGLKPANPPAIQASQSEPPL